jgi:hypothetical protein
MRLAHGGHRRRWIWYAAAYVCADFEKHNMAPARQQVRLKEKLSHCLRLPGNSYYKKSRIVHLIQLPAVKVSQLPALG